MRTATEQSVIFQVDEPFTIPPLRPVAFALQREERIAEVGITDGTAQPAGQDQVAFGMLPQVGDAIYLGFDQPLGKLLLELTVEASQARGAGIEPADPLLALEVSQGDGEWADATVLADMTGGFNFGSGKLEIQCPPGSALDKLGDQRRHRLRCRITVSHAPWPHRLPLHARAGDLLDHRRAGRRAAASARTRRRRRRRSGASQTGRPGRCSRCAAAPSCRRAAPRRCRSASPAARPGWTGGWWRRSPTRLRTSTTTSSTR